MVLKSRCQFALMHERYPYCALVERLNGVWILLPAFKGAWQDFYTVLSELERAIPKR